MAARPADRRLPSSHSWDQAPEVSCAEGCRYCLGLAPHPRRNDRAEAAGRAARSHDQEMIRRFERGMDTVAAVAHDRTLSDLGPFRPANARALVQELGDVPLGPARGLDMLTQLFRNYDGVVAAIDRVVALISPHLRGE